MPLKQSWVLGLVLLLSVILTFQTDPLPENLQEGAIALHDIKADQDYEIPDSRLTDKNRQEAAKKIRPVLDLDSEYVRIKSTQFAHALETARLALANRLGTDGGEEQIRSQFESVWGSSLTDAEYTAFRAVRFDEALARVFGASLQQIYRKPVVANDMALSSENGVLIREGNQEIVWDSGNPHFSVLDVNEVQEKFQTNSIWYFKNLAGSFPAHSFSWDVFKGFIKNQIHPNLVFNQTETELRIQKAMATVKEAIIPIKRGESIIRSGDRFDSWHLVVLQGIAKNHKQSNTWFKFLGAFLLIGICILGIYRFAMRYVQNFRPTQKDLVFLGMVLVFSMLQLRFGTFFASLLNENLMFIPQQSVLYYAIPMGFGAMLVRFIFNAETSLIYTLVQTLCAAVFLQNQLPLLVLFLFGSVYAAHAISNAKQRSAVLLAGARLGGLNMLLVLSLDVIYTTAAADSLHLSTLSFNMFLGFLGGFFASMLVLVFSPLAEIGFQYATSIILLELSNMSHPLLKEMLLKAPGTYHHSQMVGILAEAGAQSIGANALLARVGSYYHDIGKMKKAQYFVENQRGGINPHDFLPAQTSSGIICEHVTSGIELANQYKLPHAIAAMIPEHQGTKLVGYFYNKAKKAAAAGEEICESDYRYVGPKPQTRESGVVMLADTVEAATRSLPEKSPEKIRVLVEKLVNQHFVDKQLDDCELTLKDLHLIADAFVKILIGIYHQRIEYPEGALIASQTPTHDSSSQQPSSQSSNITQLFRK